MASETKSLILVPMLNRVGGAGKVWLSASVNMGMHL